jgi:hypothetical protein
MDADEKAGLIAMIIMVAILALLIALAIDEVVTSNRIYNRCRECGYPSYIKYEGNGYCVRVGSVVVPVDEACSRRIEQGKEKPQ